LYFPPSFADSRSPQVRLAAAGNLADEHYCLL
jgi:hypothetical protein